MKENLIISIFGRHGIMAFANKSFSIGIFSWRRQRRKIKKLLLSYNLGGSRTHDPRIQIKHPSAAAGKCAFLTLWVGMVCSLTFNTHGVDCNSKSELSLAVMRSNLDEGTYGDTFLDEKFLLSA